MTYALHPWDLACKLKVVRSSPLKQGNCEFNRPLYENVTIDPGMNFFILALEELGATTQYSCEGHPMTPTSPSWRRVH